MQPYMNCIVTLCHLNRIRKIRNRNPPLPFSSRSGTMRPRMPRFPAGRSTTGCHGSPLVSRCRRCSGHCRTACPDLRKHRDPRSGCSHHCRFRSRQVPNCTGRHCGHCCRRFRSRSQPFPEIRRRMLKNHLRTMSCRRRMKMSCCRRMTMSCRRRMTMSC